MKKLKSLLVLAVMAVAGLNVSAKAGIEAGYMNMSYTLSGDGFKVSNPSLNGFYVGVSDDIRLVAGLGIRVGLNYSYTADKSARSFIEELGMKGTSEKDHYLNVPLRVRYNFTLVPKVLKIQAYAGPVFSVGLSHTQSFDFQATINDETLGGSLKYNYYTGKFKSDAIDSAELEDSGLPTYKRFDVAMGGGVGIELINLIEVKVGYDWGLSERLKGDYAGSASCKRNMFYVSLGLRF